jgi:putative Mn2+ efflux pump MntP
MLTTELWLLAVALAMDAVAAALARGGSASDGGSRWRLAAETGLACGLAQGAMPLLGYGVASAFAGPMAAIDHWVAFAILAILGLNMLRASFRGAETSPGRGSLVWMAFATSVDAAAAGVTLPLFGVPVWLAAGVIGGVAAVLSGAASLLGAWIGARLGRWAGAAGGVLLILIGARILAEHLARDI